MPEEIIVLPIENNNEVDPFEFDDDFEDNEVGREEAEARERLIDWQEQAQQAIANGNLIPDMPINIMRDQIIAQRRRGGRVVVENNGRVVPQGINPQQPLRAMARKIAEKAPKQVHVYPPNGVVHKGITFARKLTNGEQTFLANFGYHELIRKHPDLKFVEKELPINVNEEIMVVIAELIDHLATKECQSNNKNFDIRIHCSEYQVAYKKYLKIITQFKQNKNAY